MVQIFPIIEVLKKIVYQFYTYTENSGTYFSIKISNGHTYKERFFKSILIFIIHLVNILITYSYIIYMQMCAFCVSIFYTK